MSRIKNFITGTCIGLGLGILLAPKEGSETRKDLKESFDELWATLKSIDFEEAKSILNEKIDRIKESLLNLEPDERLWPTLSLCNLQEPPSSALRCTMPIL